MIVGLLSLAIAVVAAPGNAVVRDDAGEAARLSIPPSSFRDGASLSNARFFGRLVIDDKKINEIRANLTKTAISLSIPTCACGKSKVTECPGFDGMVQDYVSTVHKYPEESLDWFDDLQDLDDDKLSETEKLVHFYNELNITPEDILEHLDHTDDKSPEKVRRGLNASENLLNSLVGQISGEFNYFLIANDDIRKPSPAVCPDITKIVNTLMLPTLKKNS
jgi:hypothetical protein